MQELRFPVQKVLHCEEMGHLLEDDEIRGFVLLSVSFPFLWCAPWLSESGIMSFRVLAGALIAF